MTKTIIRLVSTALGVALLGLLAPAAQAGVKLDAALSTPAMLAGDKQTTYLRVALTGDGITRPEHRAPVNVAIVLDRSGSMRGRKIEEAKRAALMAVDRLGPSDIVSVVAYESNVQVLVPATKLTDRQAVRNAIHGITAGGNTALFAGVSKGSHEVRKFMAPGLVNRIILLSDGLANVGPSSPADLADLGVSLGREGITVTTIGLGLNYNEDLMTRLAMNSDGNHFFAEKAGDLELAYATEFGDVLSVVAQDVEIDIRCQPGVRPVRVLGREADIVGRRVTSSLNQLYRDQTRYLLLELEVFPGEAGQNMPLASVNVTYSDIMGGGRMGLTKRLSGDFTRSVEVVQSRTNREVMVSVARQIAAERNEVATALRDAGRIEEARKAFLDNAVYLRQQAVQLDNEQLRIDSLSNVDVGERLTEEEWKRSRKAAREYQLKTKQQSSSVDGKGE